ncbi:Phosphoesterase HXTX [Gloeothece citriformis PCC 7424]|uniref:Phosphoesterase HXTX n=1 Tax=Gloeothece citriformis (strain PCC 7424) TaxID=65393 RepID=B7KHD4_GLOC7|nr:2'-5' RNA ligase family protein [Gloeothece citriformis]ACK69343.1 Phosphoesterase HXTX [Gloeothece citriformis PCC 7424]
MKPEKQLFFIALLPPEEVQQAANEIKHHFAEVYNSRAALKSPPHITLQPPFEWQLENLSILSQHLAEFVQNHASIPMILDGFAAFKPRVIYINVLKTPELLTIQKNLMNSLESSLEIIHIPSKNRPFSPHLTVAYKDLTKANFYQAWPEFAARPLRFEFIIPKLTLLIHQGKKWEIYQEFLFMDN